MMTIKEVRELVDFKLEGTGYMRAGGGRNYKRKDYRLYTICVVNLGAKEITEHDLSTIERLLSGIVWFHSGRKHTTQFKRNITRSHKLVMCFEWRIELYYHSLNGWKTMI